MQFEILPIDIYGEVEKNFNYSKGTDKYFVGILFTIFMAVCIAYSYVIVLVMAINFGLIILLAFGQLLLAYKSKPESVVKSHLKSTPFVSVHVATCSEPPELVIGTLKSILAQDYGHFEIIVLDNNTRNRELWEPVKNFCNQEKKIRFVHIDVLPGYKAGALNWCKSISDLRTDFVFTVDADYILERHCLSAAVAHTEDENLALIQFPQAYYNVSKANNGLAAEYDHFFEVYAKGSNQNKAVLGTGTLSLIRLSALDAIGGWPTESITEDAELGYRLQQAGYNSLFVDIKLGRGLIPVSVKSYRSQRVRWIFGNIQTLLNYIRSTPSFNDLTRDNILQLTAWINLGGLPIILSALHLILYMLSIHEFSNPIAAMAILSTLTILLSKYFVIISIRNRSYKSKVKGFFNHIALYVEGAFSWYGAFIGLDKPFKRTNKNSLYSEWHQFPILTTGIFATFGMIFFYVDQLSMGLTAFAIAGIFLYASISLWKEFKVFENIEGRELYTDCFISDRNPIDSDVYESAKLHGR